MCERQKDTLAYEIGSLHGFKIAIDKSLTNLTEQLQAVTEKQCKETGEHRWKCQNKDGKTMGGKNATLQGNYFSCKNVHVLWTDNSEKMYDFL